ncbi:putative Zn-binding protein involved in type VI secretion [Chitinivorax tropicus]|uniref:Putative Zn-binding protein involved in type VI secretion n=1 Tax=Chitinivorax tropicus TaxID=714531 RepID=A0A840MUY2_9PROT|nr:PAAR domain-containing protein [Chitinivorax tropicus]MBB5020133.1 putative Zn-binding protein involved in type VI secretion [Chitinivorax tropicus]
MKGVIRLGDPTSHGGQVISASSRSLVRGKVVARVGDVCSCPIPGHGGCVIVEGHPHHLIDGIPVAYEGHHTSCGATLIASISGTGTV